MKYISIYLNIIILIIKKINKIKNKQYYIHYKKINILIWHQDLQSEENTIITLNQIN